MNIAYVEDHLALREVLIHDLTTRGYPAQGFSCAEELDEYFLHTVADLLILDLNLPGENGISIAQRYRAAYPGIYIIMLTARSAPSEKVTGYENGADLYLPKPVSSEELYAAISSIDRRMRSYQSIENNPVLHIQRMNLKNANQECSLSSAEIVMLKSLIEAHDHRLDYWRLLELLNKEVNDKNKSNLGVYIYRLNRKLADLGLKDPSIRSLWKEGYQLTQKILIA
jgi:two-component system phosphate regulon response regulator OmpR